jgi:hypothetical protein
MPRLIEFLRQYGPREYLLMLSVAAICGLGVAALINAASGDVAGGQALLKSKAQLEADSSRMLTTRVFKPVRATHPRRPARRHQRRHVQHHRSAPMPARASRIVAVSAPAPKPKSAVVQRQVAPRPTPAPRPVVRAPRPAPKPAPAPKRSSGGGSQFDDSG